MENLGGWDHSEDHPDFDPNLLNVESWGVDSHPTDDKPRSHIKKKRNCSSSSWGDQWSNLADFDHHEDSTAAGESIGRKHGDDGMGNNDGQNNAMHLEASSGVVGIGNETVEAAVEAAVAAISETSDSVNSADRSGGSSENNNNYNRVSVSVAQHLHPLEIQSSGACPAPAHTHASVTTKTAMPSAFQQQQRIQQQSHQEHNSHQGLCSVDLSQALERSVGRPSAVPTVGQTRATTTTPTMTNTSVNSNTQHLSSLAANFMLAQASEPSVAATAAAVAAVAAASVNSEPVPGSITGAPGQDHKHQQQQHQQQHQHQHQHHGVSVVSQPSIITSSNVNRKTSSTSGAVSNRATAGSRPSRSTSRSKKKKTNVTTETNQNATAGAAASAAVHPSTLPPFYLFDAPIELRANFMQNQRRLGLPIQHDPNSYHYGETVNGFHPHQYQLPFGTQAAAAAGNPPRPPHNGPPPQLIDARHGNHRKNKNGQVKNEREQKRAQKITELIEQLRLQMEEGGWQVEARSKFHTLSNCAQYIKHMIKLTTDKENENQKLNSDLDEKRRKLERDKEENAMQEGRSDPESTTSSLTSDTTMSTARHKQEEETSGESGGDDAKKRKLPESSSREGGSSGDDSNNNNDSNNNDTNNNKKRRMVSSEATTEDSSGDDNRRGGSGTGSGSGNSRTDSGTGSGTGSGSGNSGSGGPSAQGCSISKTISTVSELTDSNRGSSSNNSGSGGGSSDDVPTEQDSRESTSGDGEGGDDQPSNSSISSDAAVASEKTSRDRHTGHKDVVFNNDKRMSRKRPPEEVTSLERSFELNYEEVFDKSNIPQLIASTSGKIVTWNECFAKATGYRKSEIERMTIFSLVKPENLANFFEIVAAALRPDDEEIAKEKNGNDNSKISNQSEKKETEKNSSDSNTNTITNSNADSNSNAKPDSEKGAETAAVFGSPSHDSLSGRDTVICSNNDKDMDVKNKEDTRAEGIMSTKKVESIAPNTEEHNEKSEADRKNSEEEESNPRQVQEGRHKSNEATISGHSDIGDTKPDSTEAAGTGFVSNIDNHSDTEKRRVDASETYTEGESSKNIVDSLSAHPRTDDISSNSNEKEGLTTSNPDPVAMETNSKTNGNSDQEELKTTRTSQTEESWNNVNDASNADSETNVMPERLLNYTAMTLPCIDFPAMKKWNQTATEKNSVLIPPLHVTVTLMSDKDPRRRCFHCVFTNFKGTNGSLGIITPELLASLFAKPLRSSRRKKRYYSSHGDSGHQHQRKRARGGTTRVGQSVSTATNSGDQEHCLQQVSTNEQHDSSPSPLLMPPRGPPQEDNPDPVEAKSHKAIRTEGGDAYAI